MRDIFEAGKVELISLAFDWSITFCYEDSSWDRNSVMENFESIKYYNEYQ